MSFSEGRLMLIDAKVRFSNSQIMPKMRTAATNFQKMVIAGPLTANPMPNQRRTASR